MVVDRTKDMEEDHQVLEDQVVEEQVEEIQLTQQVEQRILVAEQEEHVDVQRHLPADLE